MRPSNLLRQFNVLQVAAPTDKEASNALMQLVDSLLESTSSSLPPSLTPLRAKPYLNVKIPRFSKYSNGCSRDSVILITQGQCFEPTAFINQSLSTATQRLGEALPRALAQSTLLHCSRNRLLRQRLGAVQPRSGRD
jgi:hypothetical protein